MLASIVPNFNLNKNYSIFFLQSIKKPKNVKFFLHKSTSIILKYFLEERLIDLQFRIITNRNYSKN